MGDPNYVKSPMEAGSPEFAEDRTQVNSLNNKLLFDMTATEHFTGLNRNQANFDNMQARLQQSFDETLNLQKKVNQEYFDSKNRLEIELGTLRSQRSRHADMWAYEQAYDLGNPVTTGAGDTLRSAAYTPNRVNDSAGAVAGGAVDVAAAGVSTANLAVLQQLVQALGQVQQTLAAIAPVLVTASGGASTPSQTQAKPTA